MVKGTLGNLESDNSFVSQSGWCPICGAKLSAELRCPRHGQMKAALPIDPLAADAIEDHCESKGIIDLEAI